MFKAHQLQLLYQNLKEQDNTIQNKAKQSKAKQSKAKQINHSLDNIKAINTELEFCLFKSQ